MEGSLPSSLLELVEREVLEPLASHRLAPPGCLRRIFEGLVRLFVGVGWCSFFVSCF